jgi:hypothetical protein
MGDPVAADADTVRNPGGSQLGPPLGARAFAYAIAAASGTPRVTSRRTNARRDNFPSV